MTMIGSLKDLFAKKRTVEDGILAYREGRKDLPWKIWAELIDKDDRATLALLGLLTPEDHRVIPGPNGLFHWHGHLAQKPGKEHPAVFNNIGAMYANGIGIPVNYDEAYMSFVISYVNQDTLARINLEKMDRDKCEVSPEARGPADAIRRTYEGNQA